MQSNLIESNLISSSSLSICLSVYLSIYLSINLSLSPSVCLSIYLPGYLPAWKPSYSARLPHFSKLTTSKTQQFCETSSFFDLNNIQNEAILRDFFDFWIWQHQKQSNSARLPSKAKVECSADGLVPMRFSIFPLRLSKVLRLPRKIDARSYASKPEDLRLQNVTTLRKSAFRPPNSSDEDVSCTAPATENASLKILFKCSTPAIVSGHATKSSRFAHFWEGAQSLVPATRNNIWTSKSGANMWCFVHFDLEMCFAPQRRALFRHLNFQKWSEPGVLCTFWLGNVLRATTACTFSTSIFPKSGAYMWCFVHFDFEMCFVPQQCALFRHLNFQKCSEREVFLAFSLANVLRATTAWYSVHFFDISTSKSGTRMVCLVFFFISHLFSEPTFRPRSHKSLEKHRVSRFSYLFAHLHLLSSDSFSSLIFSLLLFSSLWLFPSLLFICSYCRKFDC